MTLPREAWKEYFLEPGPQDLPPGSDNQAATSGMTEEPAPMWVTESRSNTQIPSTVEVDLKLEQIHQVIHSNSAQNPTDINLYASMLASQSIEEHDLNS